MSVSVSDVHAVVVDRVQLIKQETDITNDIINNYALYNPEVAKMLLKEFQSKQIFKTHVGMNFLASLERVIKNDRDEKIRVIVTAVVLLLAIAFAAIVAAGLMALPKLLSMI